MSGRLASAFIAATLLFAARASAASWTRGDLPFERVLEVDAHPTLPAIAFAATASGVYRTADAGLHWVHVTDLYLTGIAFNPFRATEVCALVDFFRAPYVGPPAYCSIDLGTTWSAMDAAGINFLLFDRRIPDRLYSGVGYGSAWLAVSADHGKTLKVNGFTAGHPNFHGWGATDSESNVYVTSYPHGGPPYFYWTQPVYRSRDSGNTWEPIGAEPSRWIVVNDSLRHSTIYFAVVANPASPQPNYSILASSDAGTSWTTRGQLTLLTSIESFAGDPVTGNVLYAGGDSGALAQSLDGGRTWTRIDAGEIHEAPISNGSLEIDRIHALTVGADGVAYAATTNAVFTFRNVGRRHAASRR